MLSPTRPGYLFIRPIPGSLIPFLAISIDFVPLRSHRVLKNVRLAEVDFALDALNDIVANFASA